MDILLYAGTLANLDILRLGQNELSGSIPDSLGKKYIIVLFPWLIPTSRAATSAPRVESTQQQADWDTTI